MTTVSGGFEEADLMALTQTPVAGERVMDHKLVPDFGKGTNPWPYMHYLDRDKWKGINAGARTLVSGAAQAMWFDMLKEIVFQVESRMHGGEPASEPFTSDEPQVVTKYAVPEAVLKVAVMEAIMECELAESAGDLMKILTMMVEAIQQQLEKTT